MGPETGYIIFFVVVFIVYIVLYVNKKNKEASEKECAQKYADFQARIQKPSLEEPYKKLKEFFVKHGVIDTDDVLHSKNYYTLEKWREIALEIVKKSTEEERIAALYNKIPSQPPTPEHFLKAYNVNTTLLRKKLGSSSGLICAFNGIRLSKEEVTEFFVNLCITTQKMERENSGDDVSIFRFNYEAFILSLLVDYLFEEVEPSLERRDALQTIKEYANENSDISFNYDANEGLDDEHIEFDKENERTLETFQSAYSELVLETGFIGDCENHRPVTAAFLFTLLDASTEDLEIRKRHAEAISNFLEEVLVDEIFLFQACTFIFAKVVRGELPVRGEWCDLDQEKLAKDPFYRTFICYGDLLYNSDCADDYADAPIAIKGIDEMLNFSFNMNLSMEKFVSYFKNFQNLKSMGTEVSSAKSQSTYAEAPISEAPSTLSRPNTQNAKRLLALCESYIDKYETIAPNKLIPTAQYDLMKRIKMQVEADKEIPTWKEGDVDYDKIANVLLANAAFDLLASGAYHIHAGALSPTNCSGKMMAVYNGAMKWSVENGYNDEKTRQEQYDYLLKCISEVG